MPWQSLTQSLNSRQERESEGWTESQGAGSASVSSCSVCGARVWVHLCTAFPALLGNLWPSKELKWTPEYLYIFFNVCLMQLWTNSTPNSQNYNTMQMKGYIWNGEKLDLSGNLRTSQDSGYSKCPPPHTNPSGFEWKRKRGQAAALSFLAVVYKYVILFAKWFGGIISEVFTLIVGFCHLCTAESYSQVTKL